MLAAIIASKSFSAMHTIASATNFADAWDTIQISLFGVLSLCEKLSNVRRENKIVSDYLLFIKIVANDLALCGSPISDVDLVVHILNSVGSEFRDIDATVQVHDMMITFEELQDKLLAHELYLRKILPE